MDINETFRVIDVETASYDKGSICQLGMVRILKGKISRRFSCLINPEMPFEEKLSLIHGITEDKVRDAIIFKDVGRHLKKLLQGKIVVSHTSFDRIALYHVYKRYGLEPINCTWLDSAEIARLAWPQFKRRGYNLANLSRHCGIDFQHHDAGEDAYAAGLVLIRAMEVTGLGIADWIQHFQNGTRKTFSRLKR